MWPAAISKPMARTSDSVVVKLAIGVTLARFNVATFTTATEYANA